MCCQAQASWSGNHRGGMGTQTIRASFSGRFRPSWATGLLRPECSACATLSSGCSRQQTLCDIHAPILVALLASELRQEHIPGLKQNPQVQPDMYSPADLPSRVHASGSRHLCNIHGPELAILLAVQLWLPPLAMFTHLMVTICVRLVACQKPLGSNCSRQHYPSCNVHHHHVILCGQLY